MPVDSTATPLAQFTLRLIDGRKAYWARPGLFAIGALLFLLVLATLSKFGLRVSRVEFAVLIGVPLLVGTLVVPILYKKLTTDLCLIAILADRLVIYKPKLQQELIVFYGEILTYKYGSPNGNVSLRLRLNDGHYVELKTDYAYDHTAGFRAMVQAFEVATGIIPPAHSTGVAHPAFSIGREKTFFEKPLSTLLLVALVAGFVWLGWSLVSQDRPLTYLLAYVSLLGLYGYSWYQGHSPQANKD